MSQLTKRNWEALHCFLGFGTHCRTEKLFVPGKWEGNFHSYSSHPLKPCFLLLLGGYFKKKRFYLFSQRGKGREKERERHIDGCGDLAWARHVPWLEIEPMTFQFTVQCSIHWATRSRAVGYFLCTPPSTSLSILNLILNNGSVNLFCKGPKSKYFRLCGIYGICRNYSAVVMWKQYR